MKITLVSVQHINELVDVYLNAFNNSAWNENWTIPDSKKRLTEIVTAPGFIGLKVNDADKVVAMVLGCIERFCHNDYYYLREMCVIPEYQNKGVGSFLFKELEKTLKERNISKLYLLTERDSLAERFYVKNGFYKSDKMQLLGKLIDYDSPI